MKMYHELLNIPVSLVYERTYTASLVLIRGEEHKNRARVL